MDELSQRFLTAFNSIEDFLRRHTRSDNRVSFYALIAAAEKSHPGVRRNANDLRAYGDLRNAVAHRYDIEKPLATPNAEAVDVFEKICEQILKPPVVGSFFNSAVTTVSWEDRIRQRSQSGSTTIGWPWLRCRILSRYRLRPCCNCQSL